MVYATIFVVSDCGFLFTRIFYFSLFIGPEEKEFYEVSNETYSILCVDTYILCPIFHTVLLPDLKNYLFRNNSKYGCQFLYPVIFCLHDYIS